MDLRNQHGAIIDLKSVSITPSEDKAIPTKYSGGYLALSVLKNQVSLPPHPSSVISIGTETTANVEGIIEGDQRLLLDREICVARWIARLHGGKAKVMLTNFSQEF